MSKPEPSAQEPSDPRKCPTCGWWRGSEECMGQIARAALKPSPSPVVVEPTAQELRWTHIGGGEFEPLGNVDVRTVRLLRWLMLMCDLPHDAPYWTNGRFKSDLGDAAVYVGELAKTTVALNPKRPA